MSLVTDELISSTSLVRNFGTILDKISNNSISKIWILKNNNLEAFLISKDNYEKILEYIEDLEDIALIKERLNQNDKNFISFEEMVKRQNIDLTKI